MNSAEAKRILTAHRPGRETPSDADIVAALEQARRDPGLMQWWTEQQAFHAAMGRRFAEIPVPAGLREQIRARAKIISFPWWRQTRTLAAAAAIVLLLGLAALWWKPAATGSFETYRSRMVRTVLRQYRMDIQTNDMARIREFLASSQAPADYVLPPNLAPLPPLGAGVLSWQGGRVSMVCLDGGELGTLFLFVADRAELKRAPGAAREFAQVKDLITASWTVDGKVYVLAAHGGRKTLARFF